MKFIKYKEFFINRKWLIAGLVSFALFASYASAIGFNKNPEVGVMLPSNDYEPAWYINPATKEKLVLSQPIDAFRVMKKFGVGIKHSTLQIYFKKGFPKNLAGKILLDIEAKGQAYYISPLDMKAHFLGNPNYAILILKENGFLAKKTGVEIKLNNPLAEERKKLAAEDLAHNNLIQENTENVEIKQPVLIGNLVVTTEPIMEASGFSKIINVNVSVANNDNLNITEQGVVYGLFAQPSVSDNNGLIKASSLDNNFSVSIDNIAPATTYYIKAYVMVGEKIFYGNEEKFVSQAISFGGGGGSPRVAIDLPTVTTNDLIFSSNTSITSGGSIVSDGGGDIASRGVCFSASLNPTTDDICTNDSGIGDSFTSELTELDSEAMYHVRAFATNAKGTGYGSDLLTCGSTTVTDAEDNVYNVIKVGTQCWMKENLNIGTMIGAALADGVTVQGQSNNNVLEKYCYGYVQQDDVAQIATGLDNCAIDGGLYEWPEAMGLPYDCKNASGVNNGDGTYTLDCPTSGSQTISATQRGICPLGWRVPTIADYQLLSQRSDPGCDLVSSGCTTTGGKLKVTPIHSPIAWDGTDIYNFSVIPTGYLYYLTFSHHRDHAPFWTTSPSLSNPVNAWGFGLTAASSTAYSDSGNNRTDGFSVRCIKD